MERDSETSVAPAAFFRDTACVNCGYNLRGLTVDRRCPECGCPVENTFALLRGQGLTRQDLGSLLAGLRWLQAAILCTVTLLAVAAVWVLASISANNFAFHLETYFLLLPPAVVWIAESLVFTRSVRLLTAPIRARRGMKQYRAARLADLASVLYFPLLAFGLLMVLGADASWPGNRVRILWHSLSFLDPIALALLARSIALLLVAPVIPAIADPRRRNEDVHQFRETLVFTAWLCIVCLALFGLGYLLLAYDSLWFSCIFLLLIPCITVGYVMASLVVTVQAGRVRHRLQEAQSAP